MVFLNLRPRTTQGFEPALRLSAPPTPPSPRHLKAINTSTVGPPLMTTKHGNLWCAGDVPCDFEFLAEDCRHGDHLCVPAHTKYHKSPYWTRSRCPRCLMCSHGNDPIHGCVVDNTGGGLRCGSLLAPACKDRRCWPDRRFFLHAPCYSCPNGQSSRVTVV